MFNDTVSKVGTKYGFYLIVLTHPEEPNKKVENTSIWSITT